MPPPFHLLVEPTEMTFFKNISFEYSRGYTSFVTSSATGRCTSHRKRTKPSRVPPHSWARLCARTSRDQINKKNPRRPPPPPARVRSAISPLDGLRHQATHQQVGCRPTPPDRDPYYPPPKEQTPTASFFGLPPANENSRPSTNSGRCKSRHHRPASLSRLPVVPAACLKISFPFPRTRGRIAPAGPNDPDPGESHRRAGPSSAHGVAIEEVRPP